MLYEVITRALKEDREKCLEAGMNYYISKPLKKEKLFNILKDVWVGKNSREKTTKERITQEKITQDRTIQEKITRERASTPPRNNFV